MAFDMEEFVAEAKATGMCKIQNIELHAQFHNIRDSGLDRCLAFSLLTSCYHGIQFAE